ncbi:MAG: zinc-binding dehydrogenase [Anaerolineae bacterium]|nr:zinc-binding dehydrogenase [Anaerolineae bacterium]
MKAVIFREHGPVEVLRFVEDFPLPAPGPGQVRLRVAASALNRLDLFVRQGWPGLALVMPHIGGADGAGIVDALGPAVSGWAIGDRAVIDPSLSCGECAFCRAGRHNLCEQFSILGEHTRGTFAEYVVVPARNLLRLPEHVSYTEAAAAGLVYLTAWHSLITRGGLQAGESVLIVGAGGGVNTASIQIARLAGARVYVVGSSAEKLAQAEALGADVLIDRSREDWSQAVYRLTDRRGVDVVVDNVGAETLYGSIRALRKGGRLLIVGATSGPQFGLDVRYLFGKQISLIGSTMAPRQDFEQVMALVFAGRLKPVIGTVLPLADVPEGHRLLERGEVFGKVVFAL